MCIRDRGKIGLVVGLGVGYVLGTRAGRERYEQIKRGAEARWKTEPVQRGVGAVRGVVGDQVEEAKAFIRRASSDAFANLARQAGARGSAAASEARSSPSGSTAAERNEKDES